MAPHFYIQQLRSRFGHTHFLPQQWETIECLLAGEKVLLVQRTGYGKSLIYQFAALQFPGITLVFSPLMALMRDQTKKLNEKGIGAAYINSEQSIDDQLEILKNASLGQYKLLYIGPERLDNAIWQQWLQALHIDLVVIDEAHCISSWGHDFRPAYTGIVHLIKELPSSLPVLACTATAPPNVEKDIRLQLNAQNMRSLKGSLERKNLALSVLYVDHESHRLVQIIKLLNQSEGCGLIYAGTKKQAEIYAEWLKSQGVASAFYHAGLSDKRRKKLEKEWMENRYRCLVATNALGMGVDKPDVRFVFHLQIPVSPMHYYQEAGRAGRDGLSAQVVLMFHPNDIKLPRSFIQNDLPFEHLAEKAMAILSKGNKSIGGLASELKIPYMDSYRLLKRLSTEKKVFELKKSVYKSSMLNLYVSKIDINLWKEYRLGELDKMIQYAATKMCRMQMLRMYLGDESAHICGHCDNDSGIRVPTPPNAVEIERAEIFLKGLQTSQTAGKKVGKR